MRLDRYLSNLTPLSRSQAREAIKEGRVAVNGEPVRQVAWPVPEGATVALDDETLGLPGYRYFMLNKPPGYVCATEDRQHSTVLDLLLEPLTRGLHVAGRLDIDVTGLVLVTDDGAWSHRITSPRHKCPKTYCAELAEPLAAEAVHRLREGVLLRGEKRPTRPAGVELITPQQVRLTISEGRYHQVKRMFAAVDNRVLSLHRESIGALTLDPELEPGGYRPLTPSEVEALTRPAGKLVTRFHTQKPKEGMPMTDLPRNTLEIFQASLQRLQADKEFYPGFYRRFISSSEEISRIFANRDMEQLQKKLKMTLEMVADAAQGKPGLSMYFEMLAKVHKRLNINPEHFQLWKRSLLETVAEMDPDYDESVRHAWSLIIDDVTERHLLV